MNTKKKGLGLAHGLIGIMIVILIAIVVVLPTVQDAITDAQFTGTLKTITDLFPVLIGLVIFVAIVAYMKFG